MFSYSHCCQWRLITRGRYLGGVAGFGGMILFCLCVCAFQNFRREFQICTAAIQQRFKGRRHYTLSATAATPRVLSPTSPATKPLRRMTSSLYEVQSSLMASIASGAIGGGDSSSSHKVSGVQPLLPGKGETPGAAAARRRAAQLAHEQSNIIATCLNKLHPVIVQVSVAACACMLTRVYLLG